MAKSRLSDFLGNARLSEQGGVCVAKIMEPSALDPSGVASGVERAEDVRPAPGLTRRRREHKAPELPVRLPFLGLPALVVG